MYSSCDSKIHHHPAQLRLIKAVLLKGKIFADSMHGESMCFRDQSCLKDRISIMVGSIAMED